MSVFADLHIHSTYSDGKCHVDEIVSNCINSGLKYFSVTDHDTNEHIMPIQNYIKENKYSINYIPATEFTCVFKNISIHILAYCYDYDSESFKNLFKKIYTERSNSITKMCQNLNRYGCEIDAETILKNNNSPGRPHIALELIKNGYADNLNDAFNKWLIKGKPGYVNKWKPDALKVVQMIHDAKGFAFLAHIGVYKSLKNINDLHILKLDGFEIYHPNHGKKVTNKLIQFCQLNNFALSGGSDFHGWYENENPIGSYGLDEKTFEQFYNKCLN